MTPPAVPPWPYCREGATAQDSVGCRGIHVPGHTKCLAHLIDTERNAYLAGLTAGASIDHRGTTFTESLLSALLDALRDPATGTPRLGQTKFETATFEAEATFGSATFEGSAWFGSATFKRNAWFGSATFEGSAWFESATFERDAVFGSAIFKGEALFGSATFQDDASFGSATFQDDARFRSATLEGAAAFDSATFEGSAAFESAIFKGDALFGSATFKGAAAFRSATFEGSARFGSATFERYALFGSATFKGAAWLQATFEGAAWFESATFKGDALFGSATFKDEAGFRSVTFEGAAWFGSATFEGAAGFELATCKGTVWFRLATFERDALFGSATFESAAWFESATFKGEARFEWATFEGAAVFKSVTFEANAFFWSATFREADEVGPLVCAGRVELSGARFDSPVTLSLATSRLECRRTRWSSTAEIRLRYATVDFAHAVFEYPLTIAAEPAPFTTSNGEPISELLHLLHLRDPGVRMESLRGVDAAHLVLSGVDLTACLFSGTVHLDQIRMEGWCPFDTRPSGTHWSRGLPARFTKRRILAEEHHWRAGRLRAVPGWSAAPSGVSHVGPTQLAPVYRALRKAFEDGKDEPGAADFYYGEMEMRRHDRTGSTRAERGLLHGYWLLSGYGLRASRALGWLAVAMLATIVLLMGVGLAQDSPKQQATGVVPPGGGKVTFTIDQDDPRNPTGQRFTSKRFDKALNTTLNSVVFRSSGQDLTTAGTYIEMASRLTEPILLGLAVLAVRNRVKR